MPSVYGFCYRIIICIFLNIVGIFLLLTMLKYFVYFVEVDVYFM